MKRLLHLILIGAGLLGCSPSRVLDVTCELEVKRENERDFVLKERIIVDPEIPFASYQEYDLDNKRWGLEKTLTFKDSSESIVVYTNSSPTYRWFYVFDKADPSSATLQQSEFRDGSWVEPRKPMLIQYSACYRS